MAAKYVFKQDHPAKEGQPNGLGTSPRPREIKFEFLMPSRRYHPQVEPLLATYKICYTKRWLNMFLSLQGTIFPYKKLLALKDS